MKRKAIRVGADVSALFDQESTMERRDSGRHPETERTLI